MTEKEYSDKLSELLHDPTAYVDPVWVMDTLKAYPTCVLPAILLLKRNPDAVDADTRRMLQATIALNCPDRTALTDYIDPADAGWADFYPLIEPHQSDTIETIDDFLETFGHKSTPEDDMLIEKLLSTPVPVDYFAEANDPFDPSDPLALPPELRRDDSEFEYEIEEEATKTQPDAEQQKNVKKPAEETPTPGDESLLMESLSKIFIKQHRYERAYEIISKLSLKYPEKSVYFADQLRFLRKLIINQRYLTT